MQYHPEAAPGPHDTKDFFVQFLTMVDDARSGSAMPKRTDIASILIIGSGPIVIGQAAEFDYSGTQALKALRRAGYRLIVVNANSATIMTDPELSDAVYIEPPTVPFLEAIIARERPDALLPTLGGQTALNLAVALTEQGILERYGVELIGASFEAIQLAEDRARFKETMQRIGLEVPRSRQISGLPEALEAAAELGYPLIARPSFTLGGTGGGIAYNAKELTEIVAHGLIESPTRTVLLEESVIGWKEYEMEVMRDSADNAIIVCSIENLDPMGVHTGDSITVAPAQTLTDREYQRMRDASIDRRPARHWGGYRRVQHPVRDRSRFGPHGRDRDEPARLALVGPGIQGHGLPHRQGGGPAPSVTASTRSPTTSPGAPRRPSSPRSITSWSRSRASSWRSSPAPTRG